MKNLYQGNHRLAIFATYLAVTKLKLLPKFGEYKMVPLCEIMGNAMFHYEVKIHSGIFDILPALFPKHFYYNEELDEPFLIGLYETEDSVAGVFDFFSLTPEEFVFCFDLSGLQNTVLYEGIRLDEYSETKEIAENIFALIKHKDSFRSEN